MRAIDLHTEREDGFTLIEVMVVVLVIGILVAIALPTFLGAKKRAEDKAAQSAVADAFTASKVLFSDTGNYSTVNGGTLADENSSLGYTGGPSMRPLVVSFEVESPDALSLGLAALSNSGTCFYLKDDIVDGTTFWQDGSVNCTGSAALVKAVNRGGWG